MFGERTEMLKLDVEIDVDNDSFRLNGSTDGSTDSSDSDSAELTALDTILAEGDKVTDDSADVAPAQKLKKSTSLEFIPPVSNANIFNTCSRPS